MREIIFESKKAVIPRVTNIEEHSPVTRGDDIVFPKPYAGIAMFRDGRYVVAGREKGRLVLVGEDDVAISSGDPLSLRHNYDRTVCYGIAEHVSGDMLYMLVGEKGSLELFVIRIEILPDNTFKWLPSWDIRVPSVAARNKNYNTKKPVKFETQSSLHPMGFLTALLPLGDSTPWDRMEDATVLEFDDFKQLGPVLPEYHPSIAPMGSRIVVGVNNVQVFQITVDLCLTRSGVQYSDEKAVWRKWLQETFPNEQFFYGKEHDWWLESVNSTTAKMHFHMYFQYPVILSSLVVINPDLGMVENITHLGSSLVSVVAGRSEAGYVESSLDYDRFAKKDFINMLTTCGEADIGVHLARQDYAVPSNVLTWSNNPPPLSGNKYAYNDLITWWVNSYAPYVRELNPVTFVRQHPQPTNPIFMAALREGDLVPQLRSKIDGGSTLIDYPLQPPAYPWNDVEGVEGVSREICSDTVMAVTKTRIISGQVVNYILESYYEDKLISRGADVYVGKVIKGKPKIVKVKLINEGSPFVHMKEFVVSLVASFDYPYYQYMSLSRSLNGPWSMSITASLQIEPSPSNNDSFEFYVKVENDSTVEDPKPVLLDITYKKTGQ